MASNLKKNLQELIECGICLDTMVDPRVLKCQHSFCSNCLSELITYSDVRTVTCPTCRHDTRVPKHGVDRLPSDFKAKALSELVNESEENDDNQENQMSEHVSKDDDSDSGDDIPACVESPKCTACRGKEGYGDRVKYFCKYCKDYMCVMCADAHNVTSIFKNHELVFLSESKCRTEKCTEHPNMSQEYYCESCQVLVCSACVTVQHKFHTIHHSVEYFKDRHEEIKKKRDNLESVYTESFIVNVNGKDMEEYFATVNANISDVAEDIERSAGLVIEQIEKEKQKLLSSVGKYRIDFNKNLKTIQAESVKSKIQETLKDCDEFLQTKQPAQLLSGFKELSMKVEEATKTFEVNEKQVSSFLCSYIPKEFSVSKEEINIGSVLTNQVRLSAGFPHLVMALRLTRTKKQSDSPQKAEDKVNTEAKQQAQAVSPSTSASSQRSRSNSPTSSHQTWWSTPPSPTSPLSRSSSPTESTSNQRSPARQPPRSEVHRRSQDSSLPSRGRRKPSPTRSYRPRESGPRHSRNHWSPTPTQCMRLTFLDVSHTGDSISPSHRRSEERSPRRFRRSSRDWSPGASVSYQQNRRNRERRRGKGKWP